MTDRYEQLSYQGSAYPISHPDHMAAMAMLYGLAPPSLDGCRILEVGCAGGAHLIPIAQQYPRAECIGIDYSATHVAEGTDLISQLDLRNCKIKQASIMDLDNQLGDFDFIIAHGVYSWVERSVQSRLLDLIAKLMRPKGLATVNYNVFPGWGPRLAVREMLLASADTRLPLEEQLGEIRSFAKDLIARMSPAASEFSRLVFLELNAVVRHSDSSLRYDLLNEENNPATIHTFNKNLAKRKLLYLAELTPNTWNYSESISLPSTNWISNQQTMDVLCNAVFRQALICHGTSRSPAADSLPSDCWIKLRKAELTNEQVVIIARAPNSLDLPPVPPDAVKSAHQQLLDSRGLIASDELEEELAVLRLMDFGIVSLRHQLPQFTATLSEKPDSTGIARYLCSKGVAPINQLHEPVQLPTFVSQLLILCDGSRSHQKLSEEMLSRLKGNPSRFPEELAMIADEANELQSVQDLVHQGLELLASQFLLTG